MKKWFIYVSDHHEGPFTVEEIRQGISEGKFPAQGFVWAQGMSDWLPTAQIPEFNEGELDAPAELPLVAPTSATDEPASLAPTGFIQAPSPDELAPQSTAPVAPAEPIANEPTFPDLSQLTIAAPVDTRSNIAVAGPGAEAQPASSTSIANPVAAAQPMEPSFQPIDSVDKTLTTFVEVADREGNRIYSNESAGKLPEIQLQMPPNVGGVGKSPSAFAGRAAAAEKTSSGILKPIIFVALIVLIFFGLSRSGVLRPLEEKVTGAFISMPELPDIGPDEHASLVAAAKTPLSQGPAVAIAVSRADPLSPSFYIASNMPDGTRFELHLSGVSHTLLNTLDYSGRTEAVTVKHLGKTQPYRSEDGRVVPRGEYRLFIVESRTNQPPKVVEELKRLNPVSRDLPAGIPKDRSIVYEKTVFLGQKDATYTTRLKEFHDRLTQKAQSELMELKQFISLIDNQFATTQATFDRLKKQTLTPVQIKAWKQMDQNWLRLDDQLSQSLAKLTPESIKADYVYGNVYEVVKEAQKRLNEMHAFQASFFDKTASLAEAEDQSAQLLPQYEGALGRLKDAVAGIEGDPLDANGLPKRAVVAPASPTASAVTPAPGVAPAAPAPTPAPTEGN